MWDRLFGRKSNQDSRDAHNPGARGAEAPLDSPEMGGRGSDPAIDIRVETVAEGEVWWINLRGKLNGPDAAVRFTRAVEAGLEKGFRKFLVDLGAASWVDSTGIGAIASTSVRVRDAGGSFVLTQVGDRIQRVLEVTRMDQVLDCEADRERALRRLAG